jgi:hypothetical protein
MLLGEEDAQGEAGALPSVILVDANIFFAPRLRDLFMHLHEAEALSIHWTREIEDEWTRNVVVKQGADPEDLQRCLRGMREAAEDWEVSGFTKYKERFELVDAKDRHVAAAAYKLSLDDWPGQPVALVTRNVSDFPKSAFKATSVVRYSMSRYLDLLLAEVPDLVLSVTEGCRKKLQAPRATREEYVGLLVRNGCTGLARALASKWRVECPLARKDGTIYYESESSSKPRVSKPKKAK